MITINDLTDFIIKYRREKAFYNWTREEIQSVILKAYEDHTILVTFAAEEQIAEDITGIVHWQVELERKTIWINNVLTNGSKGVFKAFMRGFLNVYGPTWSIEGRRYGRIKKYGDSMKFAVRVHNLI